MLIVVYQLDVQEREKKVVRFGVLVKEKNTENNGETVAFFLFFNHNERKSIMSNRITLTLEQKVTLIRCNQNGCSLSVRQLADKYSVSKSSAANIFHRCKDSYLIIPTTPTEESNISTKTKMDKQAINLMSVSYEKFHFSNKNT